jgi:hypothetical protein
MAILARLNCLKRRSVMFQPKLRSLVATTALVSALAAIPAHGLQAQPRTRPEPGRRAAVVGTVPSALWSLLVHLFEKNSVRIDPNGQPTEAPSPAPETGGTTLPDGH